MSRAAAEKKLSQVGARLRQAREELAMVEEQLAVLTDHADEDRLRALVSDNRLDAHEADETGRHVVAMARSRDALRSTVAELQQALDDLLDRLPQQR